MPLPPKPPGDDATATAHLGWALRARRENRALTRRDVAEALGYSEDRVKQVEQATYPPSTRYMARWREVYGADAELLTLWQRAQHDRSPPRTRRTAGDTRLPVAEWTPEQTTALLREATAATSEMTPERAARLAHEWLVTPAPQLVEINAGRRIGKRLLATTEQRVDQLRHMDDFIGGGDLHELVERETRATLGLLREATYDEATGRRLLACVGELCQLAGWVAADAGLAGTAERYYTLGLHAAHAADNPPLAANLISSLSYLYANTGKRLDAVLLARTAFTGARHHASATTKALLQDRLAWAHARAGERRETERALIAAEDFHSQRNPDDDPPWVYWLNEDEIAVMAGRCYTELRQPHRAEPLLRGVLGHYDEQRARETALYASWLAEDYIQTGEIDAAVDHATRALVLSSRVNSSRGKERVATLREHFQPYRHVRAVRDFEELCLEVSES